MRKFKFISGTEEKEVEATSFKKAVKSFQASFKEKIGCQLKASETLQISALQSLPGRSVRRSCPTPSFVCALSSGGRSACWAHQRHIHASWYRGNHG